MNVERMTWIRLKAATLAAQCCQGMAEKADANQVLALTIMFEVYLLEGGDAAAKMMRWNLDGGEVVPLRVVQEEKT